MRDNWVFLMGQNQTRGKCILTFSPLSHNDGRPFRILFHDEGTSSDDSALPNRQPCFYEDLAPDQVDVLEHQVNNFSQQKASCGTMTDSVVLLKDGKEIKEAYKRATS